MSSSSVGCGGCQPRRLRVSVLDTRHAELRERELIKLGSIQGC